MKRWTLILLIAAVLVGFAVRWFSPQQQLVRRSESLLRLMEIRGGRGAGILDHRAFGALIDEQIHIDASAIGRETWMLGRDELQGAYAHLTREARRSSFQIVETQDVKVEGDLGVVLLRADCLIEMADQRLLEGVHVMELGWRRTGQGWRLNSCVWKTEEVRR